MRDLELIVAKNTGIPKVKKALLLNGSKPLEVDMDPNREYVSIRVYKHEKFAILSSPLQEKRTLKGKIISYYNIKK